MMDKQVWAARYADRLRHTLMLEPRGHIDMCGAVFTEPTEPGSHAGLLLMHNDGFATLSIHGALAAAVIAHDRGLITVAGGDGGFVFDTPAGTVRVRLPESVVSGHARASGAEVAVTGVPAFVWRAGVVVRLPNRHLRADIAYGGAFYAIVDAEAAGVPLDGTRLHELRRLGAAITDAALPAAEAVHPLEPAVTGLHGTIFTGPPQGRGADLRNVTVFAAGAVNRCASGTGTAAVAAVLDAMGLLPDDGFVHESLTNTTLHGRVAARTRVGTLEAIVPEIRGCAWITGEHTFVSDDGDPAAGGFRLG